MAVIETWIKTDLKSIVKVNMFHGILFSQDNMANLIGVELLDGGEPATVTGSVSANVLRADGTTVAVAGTLSGNKASVTLPQAAYAVPGMLAIVIKLTDSSTVTTIGAIQSIVYRASTDTIIDPGTIIPSVQDLIAAIEDAVESIPPDYSALTAEVGDLKTALEYAEKSLMLPGYAVTGLDADIFEIGNIAEAGYNDNTSAYAALTIRTIYNRILRGQICFLSIPSDTYKIRLFGYSQSPTDQRNIISSTQFVTCGAGKLIPIPSNYTYARLVIRKVDESEVSQTDITYISSNIICYKISTDTTLTKANAPADAKAVGDAIPKNLLSIYADVINPYYSERWTGSSITTEELTLDGGFIKFDSVVFIGQSGIVKKTWSELKTDIANDSYVQFMTADDNTQDTLRIYSGSCLLYNQSNNKFKFTTRSYLSTLTSDDVIMLYADYDTGNTYGLIREIADAKKKNPYSNYSMEVSKRMANVLPDYDKFIFAFATDCHWFWNDKGVHVRDNDVIHSLHDAIGYDAYINGGDSIWYGTKFKKNGISSMTKAFGVPHDNYVYCIGNHDFNGLSTGETESSTWMLSDKEIETLVFRKLKDINRQENARYYYRDFTDKKIRVIVLDTQDVDITFNASGNLTSADPVNTFVVRQNQLDWLATALNCPASDWGVIVVMHVGLYMPTDGFIDNNALINASAIINMLSAYVNKTTYSYTTTGTYAVTGSGTFSNANGLLVGVWSGHAHADGYCNKDGFNAIQTECGYPDSNDRIVGTIDEVCVDCVSVDMTNRVVTLTRIGSGSDREYTF